MAKVQLEGSFVATLTPFNRDGSVDIEGFRWWIDFHHEHGTSALLIMGSTGEASLLSWEERLRIITETAAFKKRGMPLYYGCTGSTLESTISLVEHAAAAGADGAILAVPSYACPTEEGAVRYLLAVAESSEIPLGIYNNPPRVKTDLSADAIVRLAAHPNIVILKESTARVAQVAQLAAARARGEVDIALMCCDSPNLGLVTPLMALGGQGTANMTGNVAPAELAALSRPWREPGDAEAFRAEYLRLLPLFFFTYSEVNPVPLKSLAQALGLPAGDLRPPYYPLQGEALAAGLRLVQELGLVERYGFRVSA